jgi:hypothetical protein
MTELAVAALTLAFSQKEGADSSSRRLVEAFEVDLLVQRCYRSWYWTSSRMVPSGSRK